MSWQPQSSHVSQLHHAGGADELQGNNDCGIAVLVRYGREKGILPLDEAIADQLSRVAEDVRGYPDSPSNGYVSFEQMQAWLFNHGVVSHYVPSYNGQVVTAAWSALLVDAFQLSPAQYPQTWSWLGENTGVGDHLILWLPQWNGSINWFNDSLAYDAGGEVDNEYDLGSIGRAFRGGLILPATGHGEEAPPIPAPPRPAPKPVRMMAKQACGLKATTSHLTAAIAQIPTHGQLLDLGTRAGRWAHVQWRDRTGWIMADNIMPVS